MARRSSLRSIDVGSIAGGLVLAVVGNYIYDVLNDDDNYYSEVTLLVLVVWGAAVLLLLYALRSVSSYDTVIASERPFRKDSPWRWLNTLAGALAAGMAIGAVIALLWLLPIFDSRPLHILDELPAVMNYELGIVATFLPLGIAVVRRQADWVALALFCASYSLAASIVVRVIDPEWNEFPPTWLSYSVLTLVLIVVALLVQGRVRFLIQELTRQR
jgi:hypothetical protein